MKKLLITLPNYDDATHYVSSWSIPIIKEAEKENVKIFKLEGKKVTRKMFFSFLEKNKPRFLVLNGHGSEKAIYGHNDEEMIVEEDDKKFENKIIYTIACDAVKSLGNSIIKRGGECFIGYKGKFVFWFDLHKASRPLDDEKAKSFFVSTNAIPISIIKGNSTLESVEKAKNVFKKEIARWRLSKEIEAPFMIKALLWDLMSLEHLGKATFL
ncbi:MAG: hypothetical protein ACP5O8_02580 [Candidatus Aenigmatarchaeota archaeon]